MKAKKATKICMKKSAFFGEHKKLIKLLRSEDDKKFKDEAKEQEREMKKYKESSAVRVIGIRLCEGRITDAAKKVGRALWNRKGDIAAMALGAASGRSSHYAAHGAATRASMYALGAGLGGSGSRIGKLMSVGDSLRKFGGKTPTRNTLVGAAGGLVAKKAIGLAGRTALRAGKWAKRKVLGEGFPAQPYGLMSRIAVVKGARAGKAVGDTMKKQRLAQTLKQNWRAKLRGQKTTEADTPSGLSSRVATTRNVQMKKVAPVNTVPTKPQSIKNRWKSLMAGRRGQQTAESALLELAAPTVGLAGKLSRVAMHLGPRKGKRALYVSQRITNRLEKKVSKQKTQASKALESAVLRRR